MKRQIKFRGERLDNGEWAVGDLVHIGEGAIIITNSELGPNLPEGCRHALQYDKSEFTVVDHETVGEYTGLKDKNGKEIYEGDIVKWDDCSDGRYWRFAVVKYDPDIQFDCSMIPEVNGIRNSTTYVFMFGSFAYRKTDEYLEVVGNIHDNPELMKNE